MLTLIQNKPPRGVDPDSDIIPLMASGDQNAFAILVNRHIGTLSALSAQMLGDVHNAEDITQTVFLKTWQMIPDWQPGQAKLITWMRRVTTNLCLDFLRKHKPIYTDQVPDNAADDPTPEDHMAGTQQSDWVKAKLDIMPERQKTALTLFYYQGLSQKESAEIMDVSVDAFESLLRRARKTMKHNMQNEVRPS